jgi:phenylpropionate dioxygenase-like ring-hydroxylating dioxygenase large terminal subunit
MATPFKIDPQYDPATFRIPPGSRTTRADEKLPPPDETYPELASYKRVENLDRYTSKEFARLEWEKMWCKTWHCAGRVEDVRSTGDWFRYDVGPESLIVTRGKDGINAFYNVCQHRGRQLVDANFGTSKRFVCPFHSWTYTPDGKNVNVTDKQLFSKEALCGNLDLKPVRCETWAGMIFVNFDPDAQPLLDFLGPVTDAMAAYAMEDMHVVHDVTVPIAANWKVGLEAFLEAYHVHMTHPQVVPLLDDVYEQTDVFPNGHSRLATMLGVSSPRMGQREEVNDGIRFLMAEAGMDPQAFLGKQADVRDAIVAAKTSPDNKYGIDYSAFSDTQMLDDWNYFLFPNMTMNTHPEGVQMMRFLPDPDDPGRFVYHIYVIVPKMREGCKAPFYMGVPDDNDVTGESRPARIRGTMDNPQCGEVMEQDISNMEASQKSLRSRGLADGVRFAEREVRLQVLHAEIDRYLSR